MEHDKNADAPATIAYKGFTNDWKCQNYQYEVGKEYAHPGKVKCCPSVEDIKKGAGGFHACDYPLDVLRYYPAANSKFAVVEQSGERQGHEEDSKIASTVIKIKAEIDLPGLIKASVEYVLSRCKPVDPNTPQYNSGYSGAATNSGYRGAATNSGYRGAATNSGYRGAATNSGDSGAATNSGYSGAATNSGYRGAATNSGYRGAATNSGYSGAATNSGDSGAATNSGYSGAATNSGDSGAATNSGKHGVAAVFGADSRAKSDETGAIVLINRAADGSIRHIRASKVGDNNIKANVFYSLNDAGDFVEA